LLKLGAPIGGKHGFVVYCRLPVGIQMVDARRIQQVVTLAGALYDRGSGIEQTCG
jgi:hypothetical protein